MMKLTLLTLLLFLSQTSSIATEDFIVHVSNIKVLKGNIVVNLYNKADDFPKSGRFYKKIGFRISSSKMICKLKDIPKGEYAIAIYHDKNSDNKFNQNFVGLPIEPYGFSKNVRPQMSAPDYEDVKIRFPEENNFSIALIN